jgi:hypothetical protein
MPDYDDPETLRKNELWASDDWREAYYPTSKRPNRRGEYPNATKWSIGNKRFWRSRGGKFRTWPEEKQRASANRDEGTRSNKRFKARGKARRKGFQHEFVPMEKPKIPGRVLRDAQEDQLWLDEEHYTQEDMLRDDEARWYAEG